MDIDDIIAALRAVAGGGAVSISERDLAMHAEDGFGAHRPRPAGVAPPQRPFAVVRPESTECVAAIVRLANERRFAIVPYGGGTGLMGGATPAAPAVSLAFDGMRRIREVRTADRFVWAEAGATLAQVDDALRPHGLMAGHDPWTFNIATVGGAISTDGLGYLGGRYGGMGAQTLAIEAVLPTGDIVRTRPIGKHSTGLDLRALFVGAEGTHGIVTAAALRAFPIPELRLLRGYTFPRFEAGLDAIGAMAAIGLEPALLEFGQTFVPSPAGLVRRLLGRGPIISDGDIELYLGFEGFREATVASAARASGICEAGGGAPMPPEAPARFWEQRHAAADRFVQRRAGQVAESFFRVARNVRFDFVHVALPASSVRDYWERAQAVCAASGVRIVEAGLWTGPELFSLALLKAGRSARDVNDGLVATVDALLLLAHEFDGSMEYCHGVGSRLAHLMEAEHGATGLAALRSVKRALDPNGVVNPGKLGV